MPGSESERVAAFVAGEPAAVAEVAGWVRLALAPFRWRLREELDDLGQEVLAELVEAGRGLEGRAVATFRGLVFRLAARSAIDRLRRRRRWRFEELGAAGEPAAREPSALDALLAEESRRRLLELFDALPARCRELFHELLAGRDYREMASAQGLAEGTLRVRVLRCRRQALARFRAGNGGAAEAPEGEGRSAT